jgi:hypothetical protein
MGIKGIVAGASLLAAGATLLVGPTAGATAPPPYLRVAPATVAVGGSLEFLASCYGNKTEVISRGLAAPVALAPNSGGDTPPYIGHGVAVKRPGHYTARFTCSGGPTPIANGTATAEFTVDCASPVPSDRPRTGPAEAPSSPTRAAEPGGPTQSIAPAPEQRPAPAEMPGTASPRAAVDCSPSTSTGPQVRIRPKGAPQTGDGSLALG